jgi:hypothetical protein
MKQVDISVKIAKYAYGTYGVIWIIVLLWGIIVNRYLGITSIEDIDNGRLILQLVKDKPLILFFPSFDFVLGLSLIVAVTAQSTLLEQGIWNSLQKYFGLFAGLLFVYGAYSRVTTFTMLSANTRLDVNMESFGYDIVNYIQYGNSFAVQCFLSLWLLVLHGEAKRLNIINKWIFYLAILGGITGLLAILIKPFAVLLIASNIITSFFWFSHYKREFKNE